MTKRIEYETNWHSVSPVWHRRVFGRQVLRILACVLSGLLLGIAQPPNPHHWLGILALVPWILSTSNARGIQEVIVQAIALVATYGAVVIYWLPGALAGVGIASFSGPFVVLIASLWVALPVFLPTGILLYFTRERQDVASVLGVSATLGALERIHGGWSLGIPWAHLGHTQVDSSGVSQWALILGVPLISTLVMCVNVAMGRFLLRMDAWHARLALTAFGAWLTLSISGLWIAQSAASADRDSRPTRILVVQPNLPRAERWTPSSQAFNVERVMAVTQAALRATRGRIDTVLWPENLVTSRIDRDPGLTSKIQSQIDRLGVPVILGAVRSAREDSSKLYRSSVLWWAPKTGLMDSMDKERAVPLIEEQPRSTMAKGLVALLGTGETYQRVEVAMSSHDPRGSFTFTPILCWEALFSSLVAARRSPESRVLVNLADDSWVSGDAASEQLTAYARFRAIEQRLPLIRVAHGGLTVAVDRYGRVTNSLPLDQYTSFIVEVPKSTAARVDEKIALIFLPILAGLGVWCSWSFVGRSVSGTK